MSIRFLCDSTCDLSKEQKELYGVSIVPLKVLWGQEEFLDGIDIKPAEFYERLESSEELPTTSQPSPEAFLQSFREAKDAGDDLICILLAGSLSGTCQSALIAKDIVEYDRIFIIDGTSVSLGTQLLLDLAVKLCKEGKSAEEIVEIIETQKERLCIYVVVDTLTYLVKGGRLPAAGGTVGTALNLKPILSLKKGHLQIAALARGQKSALDKMLKLIEKEGGIQEGTDYRIGYTGKRDSLSSLEAMTQERIPAKNLGEVVVGPVIGVHVGGGANAIAYFA